MGIDQLAAALMWRVVRWRRYGARVSRARTGVNAGFIPRRLSGVFIALLLTCSAGAYGQTTAGMQSAGGVPTAASAGLMERDASAARILSDVADHSGGTRLEIGKEALASAPNDLNEQVIQIPAAVSGSGRAILETTIFKPSGSGPFPLVIFNHGKERGDPRAQERSRPLAFAREFVRRGYVVVAPNRRGFAQSGGRYTERSCEVEANGLAQAQDVAATIDFMARQPYVDAAHIVVAGVSYGGLTAIAYGAQPQAGVRGLLNFAGGLRQPACTNWKATLTQAFGAYGGKVRLPSLWFYGDNDSFWSPQLVSQMYGAFVQHGAHAQLINTGHYKDDAHRLVADRNGVANWWPATAGFLAKIGMPTAVRYRVADLLLPMGSGYATIDAIDSVPFLNAGGREAYQTFLKQHPTRAFVVADSGTWSWAEGGDDPVTVALDNCRKQGGEPCRLYAVNNTVVWAGR